LLRKDSPEFAAREQEPTALDHIAVRDLAILRSVGPPGIATRPNALKELVAGIDRVGGYMRWRRWGAGDDRREEDPNAQ
jgi:hypothetical protein